MNRRARRGMGRIKAGRCLRHGALIVRSSYFYGGTCSFGCKCSETTRATILRRLKQEAGA